MIELLQQVGFSKYEAEAYAALLAADSLTGYELGKRSAVPLSRSYEILERLVQRGLALSQPGDPPRYRAEAPAALLARLRAEHTATLTALEAALTALTETTAVAEFWVVRGRAHILRRMQAMCAGAARSVAIAAPHDALEAIRGPLADARARGCRIGDFPDITDSTSVVLLLVDGQDALLGALAPEATCQVVVSAHPALVSVLTRLAIWPETAVSVPAAPGADWLRWEDEKRRRLLRLPGDHRAA